MTWSASGVWKGDRNPDIDILLPGLERGEGRSKDRLKLSAATNELRLFESRRKMLQDLHGRLLFEPLRALYDRTPFGNDGGRRINIRDVEDAYRKGEQGLLSLTKQLQSKRLKQLADDFLLEYYRPEHGRTSAGSRDVDFKIEQFLRSLGANATTSDINKEKINEHLKTLTMRKTRVRPNDEGKPCSNANRNRHRAAVQAFCTWLVANNHIDRSPFAIKGAVTLYDESVRNEKHEDLPELEPDEFQKYLEKVYAVGGEDYWLLMWAHIETGADAGELHEKLTVRKCRIDGELPVLQFKRTKTRGRGAKQREVPVTSEFAEALRTHVDRHGLERDDLVFGMCKYYEAYKVHMAAVKEVTTQHITRKGLRHVAAIRWRRAGADLDRIREWLGHRDLTLIQVYAAFKPNVEFDGPVVQKIRSAYRVTPTGKMLKVA